MKVLQILPELNVGGVERGCVDLARQLVRQNQQALVISNGGVLVKELEAGGARHIKLGVHKKSLFSILSNVPKVAKILKEEEIDIVHARSRVPALIAFLACRRSGTNFVTTCHGYYSQNFFSRVMGWGKLVIVSSSAIAQHMMEDFAVPKERLRLIPRGVDLEDFKFLQKSKIKNQKPNIFTIGVIGRLSPIKGHKYFLQALSKVIRTIPNVRAWIVGDISPGKERYKEELLMLTRRLSLDRYVEFMGWQSNIPQLLSRLDVLVLPTVTQEAFGRVLIEAAACGVPIIATRVGGIVDIIQDGENGSLVEPKDATQLAAALIRVFKQPELALRLAAAARKKVEENFTLKQMVEKTISVYKEVQTSLKILVIKLSALGDVILAIPSLRALRQSFPQADITVLVAEPFQEVLQHCPYINAVFGLPLEKGYQEILRFSSLLRRLAFDIVVDLQNNHRSHLLAYLSACSRRYGYANGKFSFLLNRKVKEIAKPLSPIEHQARTLRLLNIESVKEDLELWPNKGDEIWVNNLLNTQKRDRNAYLVGVNLGASAAWPTKRWGINQFAALFAMMHSAGLQVLVTGKGKDRELVENLRCYFENHFIDAVDKTNVPQLASLIKRCHVYVTSDSAPLHIAYAMKTPVVALFGPTDPQRHTIVGTKQSVLRKKISCSPCYKRHCPQHSCMDEITPEEVFAAVKAFLA